MDIKKIRFDEFTAAVHPDPKSLKEVIYLEGYIGKSNEAGHVRLFFDRALTDFIDIDSEDILHAVPNAKEEDTLGGSKLWIRAKASYKYGDPELKKRPEAGFMEGDIYEAYERQFETMLQPPPPQIKTPFVTCTLTCKTYHPLICTLACTPKCITKPKTIPCCGPIITLPCTRICLTPKVPIKVTWACRQYPQDYLEDINYQPFTPYGM